MTGTRKDDRKQIGTYGEELAEAMLRQLDYLILCRNWRCRTGEIDIIAEIEGILVFVEVRTRRPTGHFGLAKESIDYRKQTKVRETAQFYLHRYKKYEQSIRFDVITVELLEEGTPPHIEHLQGAF
ncbi:YraN family protein [Paenibacillus sp. N3.4]|uniref:YraN family protein n=1 Tax=Paenibacillus sp. N3.4 TaxID=2603222 RepID=UPI0011C8D0EA|nr:YraN family protein [Paenibacillus sp. N3.4]TXK77465.1 YraN family protein [Paenibacillus sp. N3.4]